MRSEAARKSIQEDIRDVGDDTAAICAKSAQCPQCHYISRRGTDDAVLCFCALSRQSEECWK